MVLTFILMWASMEVMSRRTSSHRPAHLLRLAAPVAALGAVALVAGCSGGGGSGTDGATDASAGTDAATVSVLASFYPLQYVAQQVGGEHVSVENLTPPAAEPHDLELSPAQVRKIGTADVVVYLSGFQAAVDEGVEAQQPEHVVDAAQDAHLEEHASAVEEDDHDHGAEDEHAADDGHDHGTLDPHFWLDPTRLAAVGTDVADALSAADPDHAQEYAANAAALSATLEELDTQMQDGLAACNGATLVTSHTAFGYLAERYGLEQVGVSGLDPEAEPSPARLREVGEIVRANGVKTIYGEQLLSAKVTDTLAKDLGVATAVLDPLESQADPDADYVDVMRTNLQALQDGLVCQ